MKLNYQKTSGLICRPTGGLANRLLASLSAIRLAESYHWPLSIHWIHGSDCNCPFEELFSNQDIFQKFDAQVWEDELDAADEVFICDGTVNENTSSPVLDLDKQRKIIASHCGLFSGPSDPPRQQRCFDDSPWVWTLRNFLQNLQVSSEIVDSLSSIPSSRFDKCLGVHVRRPYDINQEAYIKLEKRFAAYPPDFHLQVAKRTMASLGLKQVFLSTNSPEIEEIFNREFGERVWWHPKRSVRNWEDSAAVIDAFIDMLSLSSCSQILGTNGSSFSFLSALIGEIKLLRPMQTSEGKLGLSVFSPPNKR